MMTMEDEIINALALARQLNIEIMPNRYVRYPGELPDLLLACKRLEGKLYEFTVYRHMLSPEYIRELNDHLCIAHGRNTPNERR